MKILYIEDNDIQASITKRMLELMGGHEVTVAVDGIQALEMARQSDPLPDVVITDRRLPKMTGSEIIACFRDEPALANVPVIMLSADVMGKAKDEAMEAGAKAFFTKPVDIEELNAFLKTLYPS